MNGAAPVVLAGDVGAVPPAAGNVEHVALVERARPDGVGGRDLVGFDVPAQRLPSHLSPEAPDLLPPHLEDVDVVVVPVVGEARRGPPGRIEVHPGVVGQAALYLADQHADRFVKGVNAVEDDGGAVAHERFEPPGIHRAVPRRMRPRAEMTARVRVEVLRHVVAVLDHLQLRLGQVAVVDELGEVFPGHQVVEPLARSVKEHRPTAFVLGLVEGP